MGVGGGARKRTRSRGRHPKSWRTLDPSPSFRSAAADHGAYALVHGKRDDVPYLIQEGLEDRNIFRGPFGKLG